MLKINDGIVKIWSFPDGKKLKDYTLNEIRQRLNGGNF